VKTLLERALALFVAASAVLCVSMIWSPAHASFPATPGTEYYGENNGTWYPTLAAAAANSVGLTQGCTGFNYYRISVIRVEAPNRMYFKYARCNDGYQPDGENIAHITTRAVSTCPANSTLGGSTCTCSTGYVEQGSICISQQQQNNEACKAIADALNFIGAPMVHYGSAGLTACYGGYVMAGSGGAGGGGQSELYGPFKCSGAEASTCSDIPKPSDITAQCASGSYPGTVNGVQVCVPPTNTVQAPKTTTTAPPESGGPAPEIPGAPAGSTSETKQTTCSGSTCTTTTTYKDSGGASTGTKTETGSMSSYCAENPKAPGCEALEASTFGGACSGGFTFKGDAIQGAIAKEVYTQNCLMNAVTPESALYDAAKVKTGDRTTDLPGNESRVITSADIDQTNAIVGGTCIGDRTISINLIVTTTTVVLPFSNICPLLDYFRLVLIALGFFIAYRIIGGR